MSLSKATGRKLQILTGAYEDPQQLDLLSFVSEHIAEFSVKEKQAHVPTPKHVVPKVASYHCHGNVDSQKYFANFCLGRSNQFAVEAIKRFISNEKNDFGMIFLKAASGMGKSHILHAVANEMLSLKKNYYFSSPLMMSPAIDTLSMLKFFDIILIDDVEEIEGKAELQKVFCQLIDYASSGKIKLIVTGVNLPKDLNGCDDRIKGKLSSALIHQIVEMNADLAFEIVESKSSALGLNLPEAVKRLVSNQLGFNAYGLESLLYKLKNSSEVKGQKITLEMALEEIKDKKIIYRSEEFHRLLSTVAHTFDVSVEELTSSVRKKEFALARHVAMYILKEKKNVNVMKVAELFERDHSSVIYAVARIKKQIDSDLEMKNKILILFNEL
jgi:chromosomal replication initiator protein